MCLFFLFFFRKQTILYHKLITYKNNLICVEGYVSVNTASKFNAIKGKCKLENCNSYQGTKYIPLIGVIHGYKCS